MVKQKKRSLDAVRSAHGDETMEQLTSLCNMLTRGDAPEFLAQHLARLH